MGLDTAVVDGRRMPLTDAVLPITDAGAARGDGAFETIGVWGGRAFRTADHLDRLNASLRAVGLPAVDADVLSDEIDDLLGDVDQDAALRVYVTASGTRLVTLTPQPTRAPPRYLVPQPAPWVRPLGTYGPAGAKTMSYLPNMAATRAAQGAGGDDALLVSLEGAVLEGPTFCVLWVRDGIVHTPAVALGVVDSISRRTLVELARGSGREVVEGRWTLAGLAGVTEFMVCSSVRPVVAVRRVGDLHFGGPTPVRDALDTRLAARRRGQ